ncbi:MAG: PorV/PorQ family protein [Candidatus Desantisbacteria bacterium]
MVNKKYLLMMVLLFLLGNVASVKAKSAGECGAIGLKFPPTARAMGMGEALVAVGDDINVLYFNPAGLAGIDKEFSSYYQDGVLDRFYTCFAYSQPVNIGGLGLSLGWLDGGEATIYEFDGTERELNALKDIYLQAGLGRILKENLKVGGGIKIISSKLAEEYNASGIGIDLGLLVEKNGKNVGISLQNLGLGLKYEDKKSSLPTTLRIGGAIRPGGRHFILALEGKKVLGEGFSLGVGSEYWYQGFLALRLGYKTGNENQGIAGGFGIRYQRFQFDYAFVPIKDLDSAHRISLLLRF